MDTSVSQDGVTFNFDASYRCGHFANGDYWVAASVPGGAVTITSITPDAAADQNGWEVNPADPQMQGFDGRIDSYDASRVPSLPYAALGGSSVVKAISADPAAASCRPCVQTAVVLTVLDAEPADGGANLFRPPYVGTDKTLYSTGALDPARLPSLTRISGAPTLVELQMEFRGVYLDHKSNWTGRSLHPIDSLPDYGADIAARTGDGLLGLMFDDAPEDKLPALIAYVQIGIDLYHAYLMGTRWPPNGGHSPGRKLPIAFAAQMLGDEAMQSAIRDSERTDFSEDGSLILGDHAGVALWGQPCNEEQYWHIWRFGNGSKTCADPYGYIDGGEEPGGSYQFCCASASLEGTALALRLMPALRCIWEASDFLAYEDRWVERGAFTQPDPCAPYDGDPDHYGVTYGPDGMGGCIADADASDGVGRFPAVHGTQAGEGFHASAFQADMWTAYRASAPGTDMCIPPTPDAGVPTSDSGVDAGAVPSGSSGCGCRAVGQTRATSPWFVASAVLGLFAIWRRRRM